MKYGLVAEVAEAGMAVNYLDLLADDNVPEDWEEREDGGEGGFTVDSPERNVVDFEAVGEVANACPTLVRMGDDDDFVATIDEFLAT